MADESNGSRDRIESDPEDAVEFGSLSRALERYDYPVTNEELLDQFGDHEVVCYGEREPLAEMLSAHDGVTYESADEVREAVANVATAEPVGEGYGYRNDQV